MVAHTGLDKANPSCLLKIHKTVGLRWGWACRLGGRGESESHVPFDAKFDGDPLSWWCTPSWESGSRGLALPARTRGFAQVGLFWSSCTWLMGTSASSWQASVSPTAQGCCWALVAVRVVAAPGSSLPSTGLHKGSGTHIKAVEHVCSGHRQWGMRWVDDEWPHTGLLRARAALLPASLVGLHSTDGQGRRTTSSWSAGQGKKLPLTQRGWAVFTRSYVKRA